MFNEIFRNYFQLSIGIPAKGEAGSKLIELIIFESLVLVQRVEETLTKDAAWICVEMV